MPDDAIDQMLRRLKQLEDQAAIHSTLYAYGSALDYGDRGQFLDCFTANAAYYVDMRISGPGAMEFHGHDQLTAYFDDHTHAPAAWHKHITTNPTVSVEGDTATATSYFIRVDAASEPGSATVLASGRYQDQLVRDEGRWRIRSRHCQVENL
jgi:3-phenylpropionate/cinnamic acid dioxygenase small subunit